MYQLETGLRIPGPLGFGRLMRRCGSLPLLGLLAVAGCASGVPVEREVVVAGSRFQAVQGETRLTVRTVLPDGGGEVVGATCDLVTSLYAAELVTPARLVLPNFGPQSPELSFACRAGELSGTGRAAIITRWQGYPGYWGPPVGPYDPWRGGPFWGGWGWDGPGFPVSDYPDVSVVMR